MDKGFLHRFKGRKMDRNNFPFIAFKFKEIVFTLLWGVY